jgi:hypothetical protein
MRQHTAVLSSEARGIERNERGSTDVSVGFGKRTNRKKNNAKESGNRQANVTGDAEDHRETAARRG